MIGPWRPSNHLRFAVPDRTTTAAPKLQQLWVADKLYSVGRVTIGYEEEWRDVPTEVTANASGEAAPTLPELRDKAEELTRGMKVNPDDPIEGPVGLEKSDGN